MSKSLVIVESPGKIAKISKILGSGYNVMASVGHIRNLDPKKLSIDVNNNFEPEYIIIKDKRKVVSNLKDAVKSCKEVILAADEDREGEAIAASLAEVLNLKKPKRIVFNAITKAEIMNALKNPRLIDDKMVNAQKARMILDKIVGYRLSPLLWNNIGHGLSAGRVQSVVVKIVIEREDKIDDFNSENNFKVTGIFNANNGEIKSTLYSIEKKDSKNVFKGSVFKTNSSENINKLFDIFIKSTFEVSNVFDKKSLRNPSPPFITSSLQQEASYKLGFTPKRTMSVAQKLYESGHITYMRTDSTNLSKEAMTECKKYIKKEFGDKYYKERVFASKSKNAQEAHEAIRPTHIDKQNAGGSSEEKRLYSLIWKRTVASQMSPANINNKVIQIEITHKKKIPYYFESSIETIEFDGFLKVYNLKDQEENDEEDTDNKSTAVPKKGDKLKYKEIIGTEEYSKSIGRYNEASLVKELESKGIGRPSTFANVISKIQDKGYVERKDIAGEKKKVEIITLKKDKITSKNKEITLGKEKNKLVPTNTGRMVTKYLNDNFDDIMKYKFTAEMEELLDKIANGDVSWLKVLKDFYNPFDETYRKLYDSSNVKTKSDGELLGKDPTTQNDIYKTTTKYGPVVKMVSDSRKDTKYASLVKPLTLESVTLQDAINLLKYPVELGVYNESVVELCKGQYGFYLKHNSKNYPASSDEVTLKEAIDTIKSKQKDIIKEIKDKTKIYTIRNGEYGPYISYKVGSKLTFKSISKDIDPKNITLDQINSIIKTGSKKNASRKKYKSSNI